MPDRVILAQAGGDALPAISEDEALVNISPLLDPAPEIFDGKGTAKWDGRRTLRGIWVAHPMAQTAQRVRIYNLENGAVVDGALFRRDPADGDNGLIVSSDAAGALALEPDAPARLRIVAVRPATAPAAEPKIAGTGRPAWTGGAATTARRGDRADGAPTTGGATAAGAGPAAGTPAPADPESPAKTAALPPPAAEPRPGRHPGGPPIPVARPTGTARAPAPADGAAGTPDPAADATVAARAAAGFNFVPASDSDGRLAAKDSYFKRGPAPARTDSRTEATAADTTDAADSSAATSTTAANTTATNTTATNTTASGSAASGDRTAAIDMTGGSGDRPAGRQPIKLAMATEAERGDDTRTPRLPGDLSGFVVGPIAPPDRPSDAAGTSPVMPARLPAATGGASPQTRTADPDGTAAGAPVISAPAPAPTAPAPTAAARAPDTATGSWADLRPATLPDDATAPSRLSADARVDGFKRVPGRTLDNETPAEMPATGAEDATTAGAGPADAGATLRTARAPDTDRVPDRTFKLDPPPPAPVKPDAPVRKTAPVRTALARPYVQVGLFGVPENASRLVARLRTRGIRAFLRPLSAGGKDFNRVLAGPFADRAELERAQRTIRDMGLADTMPVKG